MTSGYHILGGFVGAIEDELQADIKAIKRRAVPWLWVFPIAGFALNFWDKWPEMHSRYLAWRSK